jgi:hypothetical protein
VQGGGGYEYNSGVVQEVDIVGAIQDANCSAVILPLEDFHSFVVDHATFSLPMHSNLCTALISSNYNLEELLTR